VRVAGVDRIDVPTLRRAERALHTSTATETIHRALELAADETALARALRALVVEGRGRIVALDADR
jgi:hypothetical protein